MDTSNSFETVATLTKLKAQTEFICYRLLLQFNEMTIGLDVDYIEKHPRFLAEYWTRDRFNLLRP